MAQILVDLTQDADLFPSSDFPSIPQGDSVSVVAFAGNDTVSGTSLGDLILGNEGNDSLTGNAGDDTIYGGQGDDIITALSGNNLLLGNLSNDIITAGAGDDFIYGGEGNDTITAGAGDDTVYAGQDDDTIMGGEGNNLLLGNEGNDVITSGAGADTIYGGEDNDTITAGAGADEILAGKGDDLIVVNAGDVVAGEILNGQDGFDTLSVLGDNDISGATVAGLEAITLADGVMLTSTLAQADSVETISTEGTATLKIDATTEQILASGIFSKVTEGVIVQNADGVVVIPPPKIITGTEGADLMSPDAPAPLTTSNMGEIINGLGGGDTIKAAGGNDTIDGGEGDDHIWGGAGTDSISGGAGDDMFHITEGDATAGEIYDGGEDFDTLMVEANADVSSSTVSNIESFIIADGVTLTTTLAQVATSSIGVPTEGETATLKINATTEEILGSNILTKVAEGIIVQNADGEVVTLPPSNIVTGTEEADLISPEAPAPLTTSDVAEIINGLGGDDTIVAAGGDDNIDAGDGNDNIDAGDGNDTIDGGAGNDLIWAGAGTDMVMGGAGDDTLGIALDGDATPGETYDGGDDDDQLWVDGNSDLSGSTVTNIETLSILTGKVLTVNLDQVDATSAVTSVIAFDGAATLKINASTDDILGSDIFSKIEEDIIVQNMDDEVVVLPPNVITGTEGADLISPDAPAPLTTTDKAEEISGLGGNDTISGAGGNDTISGGEGDDEVWGNAGADSISGDAGNDIFKFAAGDLTNGEVIDGGEGNDMAEFMGNNDFNFVTITNVETLSLSGTTALINVGITQIADVKDILGIGSIQFNATTPEIQQEIYGNKNVDDTVVILNSDGVVVEPLSDNNTFTPQPNDNITGPGNLFAYQLRNINTDNFINTLNSGDRGVGTGDLPVTLFAQLGESVDTVNVLPTLENINTIDIEFRGEDSLDLSRTMGTKSIVIHNSSDSAWIKNIGDSLTSETVDTFIIRDQNQAVTLEFKDGLFDNGLSVTLESLSGGVLDISGDTGNTLNLESATVDTFNILDRIVLDMSAIDTINITGDESLMVEGIDLFGATSIDASGLTGNLNIVIDSPSTDGSNLDVMTGIGDDNIIFAVISGDNTIDLGIGNDTMTFDGVSGNNTIDAGDGNDSLIFDADSGNNTIDLGIGDDTMSFNADSGDNTINAGDGNDRLIFNAASGDNLVDGGDGDDNIEFSVDELDTNDVIDGGNGNNTVQAAFTIDQGPLLLTNIQNFYVDTQANISLDMRDVESIDTLRLETNGVSDTLTISSSKIKPSVIEYRGDGTKQNQFLDSLALTSSVLTGATDEVAINIYNRDQALSPSNSYNFDEQTISIDGYDIVKFNVVDGNLGLAINPDTEKLEDVGLDPLDIIDSSLKEITFTGSNIRVDNIGSTKPTIKKIDASGVTGVFEAGEKTPVTGLAEGAVVTLGQGASFFDGSGSTTNPGVRIIGNAGNDYITGTMGNDVITGNGGTDTINLLNGKDQVNLNQTTSKDNILNFVTDFNKIGLSALAYNSISSGDYITASAVDLDDADIGDVNDLNKASTIIEDTLVNIEAIYDNIVDPIATNAIKFAYATDIGTLYHSFDGDFHSLADTTQIATLFNDNNVNGNNFVTDINGVDFVPIA